MVVSGNDSATNPSGGVPGISATLGTEDGYITITADTIGFDGDNIQISVIAEGIALKSGLENDNLEILPGSLLEISIKYNERNSLSIPDTSIMLEGNKTFAYKVSADNITNKTEITIGIRNGGYVEVISGLNEKDNIVAEGLKKVRPGGKIKPIKK